MNEYIHHYEMDQRKLLILTLTALVGICLFYNYNLNKKVTKIIERVLSIEASVQNITSKNKIHMNIVDAPSLSKNQVKALTNTDTVVTTVRSKPQSSTQVRKGYSATKTVPTQNNEKTLVGGVQSVLQTSLHDTTSHLQTLNNHLMKLHNRSIYETDDDEDDHSENEQYAEDDDEPAEDTAEDTAEDNDDEPAEDTAEDNDDEPAVDTVAEHYDDVYGDEEDEDEEVEYIIEYVNEEDISEGDENESVNENLNLDHYIEQAVQNNTKNKLIDILKTHDLSTFGNKNTLVKRIMTLDNFQQYL